LGNTFYTINVQLIAILLGLSTCLTTIYSWQIINDIINTNKNIHFVDASKDLIYSMNTWNKKSFFLTKLSSMNYFIYNTYKKWNISFLSSVLSDNIYMNSVYIVLVILSIFSGYVLNEIFYGFGYFVTNYNLDTNSYFFLFFDLETVLFSNQLLTCTYAILGWLIGFLIYFNIPKNTIITRFFLYLVKSVNIHSFGLLTNKWYFDIIINRYLVTNTWYFNYTILLKIVDYIITEYLASIYLSNITRQYNTISKKIQQISFKSNFYLFFCFLFVYFVYFIL
jgi:hypothetical protein